MEQVKEMYVVIKIIANDNRDIGFKPYKIVVPIDTEINLFINKQKGWITTKNTNDMFKLDRLCELFIRINKQFTTTYVQLQDYTIARGEIEELTIKELINILNEEL